MKFLTSSLLAGCLAAPALFAQSFWGVEAAGLVATQASDGSLTDALVDAPSGGFGWHSDSASADDSRGSFLSAGTVLSDPARFLALSTYAATSSQVDPTASIEASVFALESFIYDGSTSCSLTLGVNLDGAFVNSRLSPSPTAGNFSQVSVLRGHSSVDPLFTDSTEVGDWLAAGYELVDSVQLEQSDLRTLQNASIGISANPGDTFHIFAQAASRMSGPEGVADASSTLTIGWLGDISALSSLSGAGDLILIPEPRAFALCLALLCGLALMTRRRR